MRKEQISIRQYNLLFSVFKLFFCNDLIVALYIKNLLKQLPFYGKTIKPRIKKFTDAKSLSELLAFVKPKKPK